MFVNYTGLGLVALAVAAALEAFATDTFSPQLLSLWLVLASWRLASLTGVNEEPEPIAGQAIDGSTAALFLGEEQFLNALARLGASRDPLLRDLAALKLAEAGVEIDELGRGRVSFLSTEGWRTAYERLLLSPGLDEYQSVAWLKTADYWQDPPGQRSMAANIQAINQGVSIERIVILGWNLWPPECSLPIAETCRWLDDQHYRGITVWLVRESDLVNEPDLLRDFGVYGQRATGEQELDEQSRTVRFVLSFDSADLRLARERFDRLKLFAVSYGELVDHVPSRV
ncbi:MAG: hypothetical protein KF708_06905 [Pirellulales bacterium]|nr:hypothetical protein [Pirellulales bacterium]